MEKLSEFEIVASECVTTIANGFSIVELETGATSWGKGQFFRFPKLNDAGFDVQLDVFEYGVYAYAEGWHGASWDVTIWPIEKLVPALREFTESVLSPAAYLEVHYVNGTPYKHVLYHSFEGAMVADTTGLFFYNWFGSRSSERFVNDVPADA